MRRTCWRWSGVQNRRVLRCRDPMPPRAGCRGFAQQIGPPRHLVPDGRLPLIHPTGAAVQVDEFQRERAEGVLPSGSGLTTLVPVTSGGATTVIVALPFLMVPTRRVSAPRLQ